MSPFNQLVILTAAFMIASAIIFSVGALTNQMTAAWALILILALVLFARALEVQIHRKPPDRS